MAYTEAQWNRFQADLPPEDRVSYLEYIRQADPAKYTALTGGTLQQFKAKEAADLANVPKQSISAIESAAEARAKKAAADKAAQAAASALSAEDIYYTVKVGNTGKTQAQLDAAANAAATAKQITESYGSIGITSTVDPVTGKVVTTDKSAGKLAADKAAADAAAKAAADKAAADKAAAEAAIAAAKTAAELAAAKAALIKAQQDAAAAAAKAAADLKAAQDKAAADLAAAQAAGNAAAIKAAQDAKNAADAAAATAAAQAAATAAAANINVTGNTIIPTAGSTAADIAAKAAAESAKMAQRESTIKILTDRFARYNLGGLANKIRALAIDGATEATITIDLMETDEYKQRFKANDARMKKGLQVLNPAEYLNLEDGYRQVLRAYGLKQFDTDDYVSQFIANDVSAAELSNRVVTAVQRVQNADPAISKQLRDYYGIGQSDLVAYVLDPNQQFQKIERQVAASEIGVAAARQGLQAGVSVAEQLAAQGVTQAEAQKGYATIADILPTAEKLSDIYGTTMDTYGQSEAEQEVFNSLASAQRKRQRLTQREVAAFSGAAGTNRTSLSQQTVGQYQNPERTYRPRQSNRPIVGASQFPRTELWPAN